MAIQNLIIADVDGGPPGFGGCKVSVDYNTATQLVTAVNFINTMDHAAVFSFQRDSPLFQRTINLPAGTPQGSQTPPFGGWTPAMKPNPDPSGPPFVASGWSMGFSH